MTKVEGAFVKALLSAVPDLAEALAIAKRLRSILLREVEEDIDTVLAEAEVTSLAGFATTMRRDIDAIRAALCSPWTTSPVEGQANRLKTIKRSMYGRAGFALFRARVLHAAWLRNAARQVRENRFHFGGCTTAASRSHRDVPRGIPSRLRPSPTRWRECGGICGSSKSSPLPARPK